MKKTLLSAIMALWALVPAANAQTPLYGITDANSIFSIANVTTPSVISGPYSISGIAGGQALVGISFRPSTGLLYGLGYDSLTNTAELYTIANSGTTYTATAVSGTLATMDLGLTNNAALDFVSTADNDIRVIGRNGNNYIMNALDGTVTSTGTSGLSFGLGDLHLGSAIMAATAYTNNVYGADVTSEVGYDAVNNVLVTLDSANFSNGFNIASNTLHSIGSATGIVFSVLGSSGFGMDTWYDTLTHNNIIFLTGSTLLSGAHLYSYDMSSLTGTLTDLGAIGSGALNVRGISFQSVRDSSAAVSGTLLTGLSLNLRNLVYFDSHNPGNILREVTMNGLAAGQRIIGIDYSVNGMLYGLGYNATGHNYQLYTIDSVTGHVTAVNSSPITLNLGADDGSGNFVSGAFRFIATDTNLIRVVGNNGNTNVEINAATGMIAATDTALSYVTGDASFGATANLTSMAFTGFGGDTTTQIFGFDANTGNMVTFDASNVGAGFGNGSSGYLSTGLNLNTILSMITHTVAYNNSYMNIAYDLSSMSNVGFIASNYGGDSSGLLNYSILYDMTDMLTGYHKGTSTSPIEVGRIGYATPVKDITFRRSSMAITGPTGIFNLANSTDNSLLVYPNPTTGYAHIVLPEAIQAPVFVDIIDLNGNVERSFQYTAGSNILDVDMSRMPTGLYSVRVYGKYIADYNLKVVKQ